MGKVVFLQSKKIHSPLRCYAHSSEDIFIPVGKVVFLQSKKFHSPLRCCAHSSEDIFIPGTPHVSGAKAGWNAAQQRFGFSGRLW
ncbi:hypothetical protein [Tropicibacter oceani]|uniref:Uncharacterized protein n=1 Tax=Tropicibacter oceani TaxID=3058420 RepID=A0ABY8QEH9_9RHOB|nr:hypothetical protein [Tropicibacter oceani]WGW02446.1 hypothetical protein QF118_10850 [Tropicibacter oceani]